MNDDIRRKRKRNAESMLVDETTEMDRKRRLIEQEGHRQIARVNERSHETRLADREVAESTMQQGPLEHPLLANNPRYDGVEPTLNPVPDLNTDARREFDNERREQEQEKQYRLGNMPKFTPKPQPY